MAALRGVVGGGWPGGDFAVAVGGGGAGRGIIGPAGGRDRRRPAASAAIKGHSGGGAHDRGHVGGGGFSTGVGTRRRRPRMLEGNDRWLFWASFACGPPVTLRSLIHTAKLQMISSRLCKLQPGELEHSGLFEILELNSHSFVCSRLYVCFVICRISLT